MSQFDETFDFVVVGSGGGSMCAGLVMRDKGKSVLILEKTDLVGGTTARSGGVMWIPNNRFMKRDGVEDSYREGDDLSRQRWSPITTTRPAPRANGGTPISPRRRAWSISWSTRASS